MHPCRGCGAAGAGACSSRPFAETKEQIAGYDVIDCTDLDEAIEIASKHPTAWWGTIEVRPIAGITAEMPRSTEVTPAPASLIPMYRAVS